MIAHIPFDEKKYKEAIGGKELFGKGYSTLNATVYRRLSMYAAFGRIYRWRLKTVLPSNCLYESFPADWLRIRIIRFPQMFADYIIIYKCAWHRTGKSNPMHTGTGICLIWFPSCLSGCGKRFEIAFGKTAGSTSWRKYSYHFDIRTGIRNKTVLMGFGLESDAIHSPNENFSLDIFRKGIEADWVPSGNMRKDKGCL